MSNFPRLFSLPKTKQPTPQVNPIAPCAKEDLMKNKKWLAFLAVSSAALTGLIVLLSALIGQTPLVSGQKGQDEKDQNESISKMRATFPVVDYLQTSLQDADRRAKSRKYNLAPVLSPNTPGNVTEAIFNEWAEDLTALPIEKSQVVVVGTVVEARAYLSDNKQAVYSEFTIEIEKIFKNETGKKISVKDKMNAERQGGIVRFPSGVEQWIFISGQGMPVLQKRYLFFLSYDSVGLEQQKSDLSILTGYEIKDGYIYPLDNPGGGSHPIATSYKGKDEKSLFDDLDKFLKRKLNDSPKKEVQQ